MASLGETWQQGEESLVEEDVTGEPKMEMEETGEEQVGSESMQDFTSEEGEVFKEDGVLFEEQQVGDEANSCLGMMWPGQVVNGTYWASGDVQKGDPGTGGPGMSFSSTGHSETSSAGHSEASSELTEEEPDSSSVSGYPGTTTRACKSGGNKNRPQTKLNKKNEF